MFHTIINNNKIVIANKTTQRRQKFASLLLGLIDAVCDVSTTSSHVTTNSSARLFLHAVF